MIDRNRPVEEYCPLIIVTVMDTDGYQETALAGGAAGLVSKANLATDPLSAIRRLVQIGGCFIRE